MSTKNSGTLFIIAAPSGAGKTSLVKALSKKTNNLSISTSHTTRQPREDEKEGEDYFFIEEKKFIDSITKFKNIDSVDLDVINKLLLIDTMSKISIGFIINQISKNLDKNKTKSTLSHKSSMYKNRSPKVENKMPF